MKYTCFRCGSKFKLRNEYNNHIVTPNKCKLKYISLTKSQLKDDYYMLTSVYSIPFSKLEKMKTGKTVRYPCLNCNKLYKSSSSLYNHRKNHCLSNKNNEDYTKSMDIHEHNYSTFKNDQTNIQGAQLNSNNVQNSNNIQNIHNTQNSHNTQHNNVTNNITINNYDNDDILTDELRKKHLKIIRQGHINAIPEVFKSVHIDTPENRNVYIKDVKDGFGMVMLNGEWTPIQMDEILSDMVLQSANWIGDAIENNRDKLGLKGRYAEKMINKVEDENSVDLSSWKSKIKYIAYGHCDLVKSNYENIIGSTVKLNLKPKRFKKLQT